MKHPLANTRFVKSAMRAKDFIPDSGREVAFIGRSNAGKSSAINAICKQKLAKTSKTPGRTQTINFFSAGNEKHLVDLPGYGYSTVAEKTRKQWDAVLVDYFSNRQSLCCVFLIVDIRRTLGTLDIGFIDWVGTIRPDLLIHVLLTKSDKLAKNALVGALKDATGQLNEVSRNTASIQTFSVHDTKEINEVRRKISDYLAM